jgi:hypothetical protein
MGGEVIVGAPGPDGRRVSIRGVYVGIATSLEDVQEFMRRAGLGDLEVVGLLRPGRIEWRGGGPDDWA